MARFWRRKKKADQNQRRRPLELGAPLGKTLEFLPPEGVVLKLNVASLGSRLGAYLLDGLILNVVFAILVYSLVFAFDWSMQAFSALVTLLYLLFGVPYYVISELLMNGRTLGKKIVGIRVVSRSGKGLTTHAITVRNLMKQAELSIPFGIMFEGNGVTTPLACLWLCFVAFVPWRSKINQRLGDLAADTAVVEQPRAVLLPDLATDKSSVALDHFTFTTAQLDLYGAYELQVLEGLLQASKRLEAQGRSDPAHITNLHQVAEKIRAKINYSDQVLTGDERAFLQAFYTAQRGYLEQKKLFGEERADKFHSEKVD
ncbi:RDD family protein [Oryzifoliimicrobium ureilyticus]|uniref:RDD family protein n=1 Tax=Oryzifoliimicrobium ureilyticus TaxID=3113724 RepID=UPI0030768301